MSQRSLPVFKPFPPGLSAEEETVRRKRQSHAEWGLAVAALGGTVPSLELLNELQRYIDGELTLAELAQLPAVKRGDSAVAEAIVRRENLANYGSE